MNETLNNDVLYSSNKDVDGSQDIQRVFEPAKDIIYDIRDAPKPAMPVNSQPLPTSQTLIPKPIIIPEIVMPEAGVNKSLLINEEKLIRTYGAVDAAGIVNDIKTGNPLPKSTTEQLVTSGIVTEAKNIDMKVINTLPSVPKNKSNGLKTNKIKIGFIDQVTNLIYNLIYWRNG